MRPRLVALLLLACLAPAGCRTDPNIVLLERENRELEDTIYELQACLDEYQEALSSSRRQNQALEAKLAGDTKGASPPPRVRPEPAPATKEPSESRTPERRGPATAPVSPDELIPPTIEMPGTPLPEGDLPKTFRTPDLPSEQPGSASPPNLAPPTSVPKVPGTETSTPAAPATGDVAAIKIRKEWTGGCNLDGRGPDDGLWVFVEPRNARGNLCTAAGPVSIVVLDPALSGDAARVARWDFTAEEIALATVDEGIGLEMVWPQGPPPHGSLQLYVRYTAPDGRKLEDNCAIEVSVPSQQADSGAPALLPHSESTAAETPQWRRRPSTQPPPEIETPRTTSRQAASTPVRLQSAAEPVQQATRPTWSPNR